MGAVKEESLLGTAKFTSFHSFPFLYFSLLYFSSVPSLSSSPSSFYFDYVVGSVGALWSFLGVARILFSLVFYDVVIGLRPRCSTTDYKQT